MLHRRHPSLARNRNVEAEELRGWGVGAVCTGSCCGTGCTPPEARSGKENSQREGS